MMVMVVTMIVPGVPRDGDPPGSIRLPPRFTWDSASGPILAVAHMVEIVAEPGLLRRAPPQPLLRQHAGGRGVHPREEREPAEMTGRLLGGHGDDRNRQAPADGFGDLSDRHTLLGDRGRMSAEVIPTTS